MKRRLSDPDAFAIGETVRQLAEVKNWRGGDIERAERLVELLAARGFSIKPTRWQR